MIRNVNLDFSHVVKVIQLRELMAKTSRIRERTRLASRCHERRIDSDADDVGAWRNRILAVSSIQNKKLTGKLPNISIGPTDTNSLIARNGRFCVCSWRATAQIVSFIVSGAGKFLKFFYESCKSHAWLHAMCDPLPDQSIRKDCNVESGSAGDKRRTRRVHRHC